MTGGATMISTAERCSWSNGTPTVALFLPRRKALPCFGKSGGLPFSGKTMLLILQRSMLALALGPFEQSRRDAHAFIFLPIASGAMRRTGLSR
jgi:hypothetical protein